MDSATGKTVWEKDFPVDPAVFDRKDISLSGSPSGGFDWIGVSSVPVVWQGKIYVQGFMGIYCLSTKDGSLVWKAPTDPQHSSPLVAGGVVYNCGVAYNAEDGNVLWKNPNFKQDRKGSSYDCQWGSPVLWTSGGANYVITDDGRKVCALDMKTGNTVWKSDFGACSYGPVISGDILIACNGQVQAARLTPTGLQPLWNRKEVSSYGPLVYQGRVYCYGNIQGKHEYRWWCLDLKTGQDIWTKDVTWSWDVTSMPVLADGKIITPCGTSHFGGPGYGTVEMLKAGPEGYVQLALINKWKPKIVAMTSPAIADGRLFFRLQDGGVGCWDLTKNGNQ
jgi:outer membrane protein assembly factor BamB